MKFKYLYLFLLGFVVVGLGFLLMGTLPIPIPWIINGAGGYMIGKYFTRALQEWRESKPGYVPPPPVVKYNTHYSYSHGHGNNGQCGHVIKRKLGSKKNIVKPPVVSVSHVARGSLTLQDVKLSSLDQLRAELDRLGIKYKIEIKDGSDDTDSSGPR